MNIGTVISVAIMLLLLIYVVYGVAVTPLSIECSTQVGYVYVELLDPERKVIKVFDLYIVKKIMNNYIKYIAYNVLSSENVTIQVKLNNKVLKEIRVQKGSGVIELNDGITGLLRIIVLLDTKALTLDFIVRNNVITEIIDREKVKPFIDETFDTIIVKASNIDKIIFNMSREIPLDLLNRLVRVREYQGGYGRVEPIILKGRYVYGVETKAHVKELELPVLGYISLEIDKKILNYTSITIDLHTYIYYDGVKYDYIVYRLILKAREVALTPIVLT